MSCILGCKMYYWTRVLRENNKIEVGEINLAIGKVRIYKIWKADETITLTRKELSLKTIKIEGEDVVIETDKEEIRLGRASLGSYLPTGYDDLVRNANGVFAEASKILESGSSGDP